MTGCPENFLSNGKDKIPIEQTYSLKDLLLSYFSILRLCNVLFISDLNSLKTSFYNVIASFYNVIASFYNVTASFYNEKTSFYNVTAIL